jgi:hypothetical protein
MADFWQDVPFFDFVISPTTFTFSHAGSAHFNSADHGLPEMEKSGFTSIIEILRSYHILYFSISPSRVVYGLFSIRAKQAD